MRYGINTLWELLAGLFWASSRGFIGSKIVNKSGQGLFLDIALGIVGAIVRGFLFSLLGALESSPHERVAEQ